MSFCPSVEELFQNLKKWISNEIQNDITSNFSELIFKSIIRLITMDKKINQSKVQVRWVKLSNYFGQAVHLKTYLTSDEIEKAYKYKFDTDRSRFIIGRAFLRKMLGDILDFDPFQIKIESDNYGKLFLSNEQYQHLHFNLSHSDDYIIYAFCTRDEVGVDIEKIDSLINHLEIARNHFTNDEISFLQSTNQQALIVDKFFRIWTRKEALLKAVGTGILTDLRKIEVLSNTIDLIAANSQNGSPSISKWIINDLNIDINYKAAIAYRGNQRSLFIEQVKY